VKRLVIAGLVTLLAWPKLERGTGSSSDSHGDWNYWWIRCFLGGHVIEIHWAPWR
jgi:hypothetical protein